MRERLRERGPPLQAERQPADRHRGEAACGPATRPLCHAVRPGRRTLRRRTPCSPRRSGPRTGRGPAERSRSGAGSPGSAARRAAAPGPRRPGPGRAASGSASSCPRRWRRAGPTISPGPNRMLTSLTAVKLPNRQRHADRLGQRQLAAARSLGAATGRWRRVLRHGRAAPAGRGYAPVRAPASRASAATVTASCRSGSTAAPSACCPRRRVRGALSAAPVSAAPVPTAPGGHQTRQLAPRRHARRPAGPSGRLTDREDRRPASRPTICSGVPDASGWPPSSTRTAAGALRLVKVGRRQDHGRTGSCRGCDQPPQARPADRVDAGVGSSRISSSGRCSRAAITPSFCRMPPDSWPASRSRAAARPARSDQLAAARRAAVAPAARRRRPRKARFSATVRSG